MAIPVADYETVFAQILAFFRNRFPGKDTHTESFLGKCARAIAMAIFGLLKAVEAADADALPSDRSSSQALRDWAFVFGVPADTFGHFGPKAPSIATGGAGYCTGTNGTVFADGSLLTAPDGRTQIQLSGTATIPGAPPGTGQVLGRFIAVTPGSGGNLDAGSTLTWESPPSGADGTVTLTSQLAGGLDDESDTDLLGRTLDRMQKPPKGGAANDYRSWAESVDGISRPYVYPLRGGLNTVQVVIVADGSGVGRLPSGAVKTAVDAFVATVRPATVEGYQTVLPIVGTPMVVRVRVVPSPQYAFDWASAGVSYSVAAYATPAGAPAMLTLTPAPPADLVNAVTLRQDPRIQVRASGATSSPALLQARVMAVAGSVLTLDAPFPAGAVNVGNSVFPGSPLVAPVTNALLAYVDALGPSRQSGYADPNDPWEDVAAIARLTQIVLDLRDVNGVPLARNIVAGGITIDGNQNDREAVDVSAAGPELLVVGSIMVTD